MGCISKADRALHEAGLLRDAEARAIAAHLRECGSCVRLLRDESAPTLGRDDAGEVARADAPTLDATDVPTLGSFATPGAAAIGRGATFGRHVVLGFLGAGGMGEVYSAYDPELDRKTAIKVIRARAEGDEQRARMLREAQAMARVSHANVIAVYDVGVSQERVFFVMEFVQGRTLRQWQDEGTRSWREILAAYVAAGRGVAAAHAAGLVHRDFKPDNVLVGRDCAVKVTDFGIARALDYATTSSPPPSHPPRASDLLAAPLTRQGSVLGTPGYMAPEQFRGGETDGRTDQFSFCAALFEALYGKAPFEGETFRELSDAVSAGRVVEPPKNSAVSASVRRAVLRGLSASPAARHPSMEALLRELSGVRQGRRALLAGASAAALAAALLVAAGTRMREPAPCGSGRARLEEAWSPGIREAVSRSFLAIDRPYAADVLRHTVEALDAYGDRWVAMHQQACEATRVSGEQSEQVMTLRMACLEHRHQELQALTRVLADADARVLEKSVNAASSLAPVEECARATSLLSVKPLPSAGPARAEIDAVRLALASVEARASAGRGELLRTEAEALVARARAVGYVPLEAEALLDLARIQASASEDGEAVESLLGAVYAAEAGDARETKVQAELQLLHVLPDLSRFAEAASWAEMARASASTLEGAQGLDVDYHAYLARSLFRQGRHRDAVEHFEKAIALERRTPGRNAEKRANLYLYAASPLSVLGRAEEALDLVQRAETLLATSVAERHPTRIRAIVVRAVVQHEQGAFAQALASDDEAAKLADGLLPPTHQLIISLHNNRGEELRWLGRYEEALAEYRRADEVAPPDGAASMFTGVHKANIGLTLVELGRPREAEASAREAQQILERTMPADHEWIGHALTGVGLSRLALDDPGGALPALERALAIYLANGALNVERQLRVADVRFAVARARYGKGDRRGEVRELAYAARGAYRAAGRARRAQDVDAWLAASPSPSALAIARAPGAARDPVNPGAEGASPR